MNKLKRGLIELAHRVDRRVGWHRLPVPLALPVLAAMRERLRERNLYDTGQPTDLPVPATNGDGERRYLTSRTVDGTFTDLDDPLMGSAGTRFGRNFPLEHTFPEQEPRLSTPNPRTVSLDLMTRRGVPAGDDPERARGSLDPVRGPRLVQPRAQRSRGAVRDLASATETSGPNGRW